ncbi:MAG: dipeptidase [Pleurocapsa minor GSE-CHR-MK-17-07R]|jgi:membrane dipeptidase|nr:dipeptidase [Pleurocapsa minor GSE-CHR-MK 17-07R]
MIIFDAHQDIAYNALSHGRDYTQSALVKRREEEGGEAARKNGLAMLGLPEALLGRVGIAIATIFTEPGYPNGMTKQPMSGANTYKTPREAYTLGMKQLDIYNSLFDRSPRIRPVRSLPELDAVLATWADGTKPADHVQGLILSMENADPIIEPKQFEEWYERGVRAVGPAWAGTRYCGGTGDPGGLTSDGYALLEVMGGLNALLDLSHMAEESFFQALDRYEGTLIASHSNPRRFVPNRDVRGRHLTDDMIRRLAERGGVIGLVPYNFFLHDTWVSGDPAIPFSRYLDVIDYVCQLTGSAAHVGIGTDFDGGFGAASTPDGLDTEADLLDIPDGLRQRGYSQADIDAITHGNFLAVMRRILPAS